MVFVQFAWQNRTCFCWFHSLSRPHQMTLSDFASSLVMWLSQPVSSLFVLWVSQPVSSLFVLWVSQPVSSLFVLWVSQPVSSLFVLWDSQPVSSLFVLWLSQPVSSFFFVLWLTACEFPFLLCDPWACSRSSQMITLFMEKVTCQWNSCQVCVVMQEPVQVFTCESSPAYNCTEDHTPQEQTSVRTKDCVYQLS